MSGCKGDSGAGGECEGSVEEDGSAVGGGAITGGVGVVGWGAGSTERECFVEEVVWAAGTTERECFLTRKWPMSSILMQQENRVMQKQEDSHRLRGTASIN